MKPRVKKFFSRYFKKRVTMKELLKLFNEEKKMKLKGYTDE